MNSMTFEKNRFINTTHTLPSVDNNCQVKVASNHIFKRFILRKVV